MLEFGAIFVRRSTPGERVVLLVVVVLICLGLGGFLLYLGYTAPPDQAEDAATARTWGYSLLAVALAIWVAYRLIGYWLEH